jgi:hypothetical protein
LKYPRVESQYQDFVRFAGCLIRTDSRLRENDGTNRLSVISIPQRDNLWAA